MFVHFRRLKLGTTLEMHETAMKRATLHVVEFEKWDQNRGQNFRRAIKESLMTLMTDFLEEKGWSSSEEMD